MIKHCLIALTLSLGLLSPSVSTAEKPLKVVVCAGQSNMVGKFSQFEKLPAEMQIPGELVAFNGTEWLELRPENYQDRGFGPEIAFAHTFSKLIGEPVGIVKHALGSTSLSQAWSADYSSKWAQYPTLRDRVQAAIASDREIEIVGMIWMQGEADSMGENQANSYGANLVDLISRARRDFQAPNMYFIAGRVNPPLPKFAFADAVRKAQEECPVEGYSWIDCDSLEKGGDDLHYTLKGLNDMGVAFAHELKKQMDQN